MVPSLPAIYFDLGGGTTDIAIIDMSYDEFNTLCVVGSNHLGGEDIDQLLVDQILLPDLLENYSITLDEELPLLRLRQEARKAKENLYVMPKVHVDNYMKVIVIAGIH